jgi:hypothetical protein
VRTWATEDSVLPEQKIRPDTGGCRLRASATHPRRRVNPRTRYPFETPACDEFASRFADRPVSKSCPTVQDRGESPVTRKDEFVGIIPVPARLAPVPAGEKPFVFCPSGGLHDLRRLGWVPSPDDTLTAHIGLAGAQGATPATRLCRGVRHVRPRGSMIHGAVLVSRAPDCVFLLVSRMSSIHEDGTTAPVTSPRLASPSGRTVAVVVVLVLQG